MARERFVTWREYLAKKTLRTGLAGLGMVVELIGVLSTICLIIALCLIFAIIVYNVLFPAAPYGDHFRLPTAQSLILAACAAGAGLTCWALLRAGRAMLEAAEDVPTVTLITRANIAELPADQSLVRGALRPEDDAADSLLRGVAGPKHAHAEGLLLPVQTLEDHEEVKRLIDN